MDIKEKWTGKIVWDSPSKTFKAGNITLSADEIESIALCLNGVIRFSGDNDADKGLVSPILGMKLKHNISQPGRKLNLLKTSSLLLRPENEDDAMALVAAMAADGIDVMEPGWTSEDFPIDRCVVEAKRAFSDYIRGGSPGSKPYGRAGLVAPIILPELDLEGGSIVIKYVGTNGYHQISEWFTAHPNDTYVFGESDRIISRITTKEGGFVASVDFQKNFIEKDENAKGLWMIHLDQPCDTAPEAISWICALQMAARGEYKVEDEEIPEAETAELPVAALQQDNYRIAGQQENPAQPAASQTDASAGRKPVSAGYDTVMLKAALDMLHTAGILTDDEWTEKCKLL